LQWNPRGGSRRKRADQAQAGKNGRSRQLSSEAAAAAACSWGFSWSSGRIKQVAFINELHMPGLARAPLMCHNLAALIA